MFCAVGEAIDIPMLMQGSCAEVRLDTPVDAAEQALLAHGFAQHFVVAYGDIKENLEDIGRILSIEVVAL